jgi:excisionase family DNA binding protein
VIASPLEAALRDLLRDVVRVEIREALAEHGPSSHHSAVRNVASAYLSISKAAQFADVAPGTLRRWIRTGRLPARRAGRVYRIARDELEAFLARHGRGIEIATKARRILRAA